jgi:hypothetical protein
MHVGMPNWMEKKTFLATTKVKAIYKSKGTGWYLIFGGKRVEIEYSLLGQLWTSPVRISGRFGVS